MAFFRAYIAPFLIVLIFLLAMLSVSARIFLPSDMMAPAPVGILEAPQAVSRSAWMMHCRPISRFCFMANPITPNIL